MKKMLVMLLACCMGVAIYAQTTDQTAKKQTKKDCIMMKDGKIWQTKDGKTEELTADVALENGTTVMKDGTVKMKDGTTKMLKDGDCVWMDGKITHMAMKKKTEKTTGG
ncbi:MAG: DUF6799 domain-containing protein [Bacteroidota bacterium]